MKIWKSAISISVLVGVFVLYYINFNEPPNKHESKQLKKIHEGRYIIFYNIDNQALVYVNDSLIFDSGIIDNNPALDLEVDLDKHLLEGDNKIVVELFNHDCEACPPTPWQIRYEIIDQYEVLDFAQEGSYDKRDEGGVKFSRTYQLSK